MAEDKRTKSENKNKKAPADNKKTEEATANQEEKAFILVLEGAGTLASRGMKFVKDIPQKVENPELAKKLLASGLFKSV